MYYSKLIHFNVFQDVINTLLPKVLTKIIEGLQDLDDDVRAVAAASLVPVVESLVYLQTQKVSVVFLHFLPLELIYFWSRVLRKTLSTFFLLHPPFFLGQISPLMYVTSIIHCP